MPHAERLALYNKWKALHLENTAAEFTAAQAQHEKAVQELQVMPAVCIMLYRQLHMSMWHVKQAVNDAYEVSAKPLP